MGEARRVSDQTIGLRFLGPLEVSSDGAPIALGGPKPRALLAVLALDVGRVVSVDRLVEDLWPGTPPDTASHAVEVYVSQLRKSLGDTIARHGPGYALELEPEAVDIHRFTRLAKDGHEELRAGIPAAATATLGDALALWRGPALTDFAYEPFAQAEIAHLDELRFAALEDRIDADLSLGRHAELISEIEALVEAQPLRERPRSLLMRALYLAGRQADALAAYRDARAMLIEDLGIEPGPELRQLEAAILRQDDALLPTARPAVMRTRRLAAVASIGLEVVGATDLEVEDDELDMAASAVIAAATRHGGVAERLADGSVTAVFGVPVAHEDDPIRAARTALESRAALALMESITFSAGIEIGEVVAADRTASGPPVRAAALLRQRAADDEILISETAARRLTHAARLEAAGDVWSLAELAEHAPAFQRRLDAPLVGRKRELAALRRALKLAVDGSAVHVAVVVGPPGVGKSRLATEFARRAKGVTALFGRCLSYGDGITYWPLREVLQQASASPERDAVLAALDAETPPPAPEIAWLFRQFCEASARKRPLVLVFDDVHWAEATFLELVEHLADKGVGPIAAVCLAREELREDRPEFLEHRINTEQVLLDSLSAAEMDSLLDGLGGAILETDQRARIVETAEGNPFFLEQLLALALEGGLAERALPETIQALLAARLDLLGPGERAVLERGAVVGREFSGEDVVALLDPNVAPTADAHLQTLAGRGFVRQRGAGSFGFRHVLVQEAVYRAAPKRLRAELHERYADRLDTVLPDLPDLDEFVGYHLEQAFRLRSELGESDRRADRLADDASQRLGVAGMRAFRRGDSPATANLLGRAIQLLSHEGQISRELRCNLAIATAGLHDSDHAVALLEDLVADARTAEDDRIEAWARIELVYLQVRRGQLRTVDDLLAATAAGIPIFERFRDHRALGRAWLFTGWAHGGNRGNHAAWADAAERALVQYRAAAWPASTCLGEIASALYWGPTPVTDAMARCEQLLGEAPDPVGTAYLHTFIGGLVAQLGEFDRARTLVTSARDALEDRGHHTAARSYCMTVLGDIELLAGESEAATAILGELCDELSRNRDLSHLASRASDLAKALVMQGAFEEAERWTYVAEEHAAADDINAQMMWRPIRARIYAERGTLEVAEELAREGVRLSDQTDDLNRRAEANRYLGEVLRRAARPDESSAAFERALELHQRKGNLMGVALVRTLLDELAVV